MIFHYLKTKPLMRAIEIYHGNPASRNSRNIFYCDFVQILNRINSKWCGVCEIIPGRVKQILSPQAFISTTWVIAEYKTWVL